MPNSHKTAPGTETRGGVNSTMGNPMKASSSPGSGNGMKAPFSQPHSTGGGAIPTKVYETGIKTPSVPAPSQPAPLGAKGGQQRKGAGGLLRDRK